MIWILIITLWAMWGLMFRGCVMGNVWEDSTPAGRVILFMAFGPVYWMAFIYVKLFMKKDSK